MRITYVAKHSGQGNDDEGAIAYALEELGHTVKKIGEEVKDVGKWVNTTDLLLYHKWSNISLANKFNCPKVFWYFDLVNMPNQGLDARFANRMNWIERATRDCDLGFLTDGDWVNADTTGKLVWLPQGADSRFTGPGKQVEKDIPILMTGIKDNAGRGRLAFVQEMERTYGDQFVRVGWGVHQRELADLIARAKIVVAPDCPCTDHYWSNRVYLTLGFQGFLLHPYCSLRHHYTDYLELVMYTSIDHLHDLITHYMSKRRESIAHAGYERTMKEHTYIHRCEELIRIVRERVL